MIPINCHKLKLNLTIRNQNQSRNHRTAANFSSKYGVKPWLSSSRQNLLPFQPPPPNFRPKRSRLIIKKILTK